MKISSGKGFQKTDYDQTTPLAKGFFLPRRGLDLSSLNQLQVGNPQINEDSSTFTRKSSIDVQSHEIKRFTQYDRACVPLVANQYWQTQKLSFPVDDEVPLKSNIVRSLFVSPNQTSRTLRSRRVTFDEFKSPQHHRQPSSFFNQTGTNKPRLLS